MIECDITFIILAYNSARTLRGAIESCIETVQHYRGSGRIVVYDNTSGDDSSVIIDEFADLYPQ